MRVLNAILRAGTLSVAIAITTAAASLLAYSVSNAAAVNSAGETTPSPKSLLQLRDSLILRMAASPFKIPLLIESAQAQASIKGDIYAEIKYPFATVSAALSSPQAWCDILILHLNTKSCQLQMNANNPKAAPILLMSVGKKAEQAPSDAYPVAFVWNEAQRNADFLQVNLSAESGPLSTRDYRILLNAVPSANGQTFIHLSYSYGFGSGAKFLMKAYLNTIARDKVGFTVIGKQPSGEPIYVDGLLGLVERNSMRYHLAVEAYLGALRLPKLTQFEKRINDWYAATERYPQQLREIDRRQYIDMKRREYRNSIAPI